MKNTFALLAAMMMTAILASPIAASEASGIAPIFAYGAPISLA